MTSSRTPHRRRFENWCRLGGEPLIALAQLVEDRLVPLLIESGFERAETYWTNPDEAVADGREPNLSGRPAGVIQASGSPSEHSCRLSRRHESRR